jgi:hypothetical protein
MGPAVAAAASIPARRMEVPSNARCFELLWGLGEVLGRSSSWGIAQGCGLAWRRPWRSAEPLGHGTAGPRGRLRCHPYIVVARPPGDAEKSEGECLTTSSMPYGARATRHGADRRSKACDRRRCGVTCVRDGFQRASVRERPGEGAGTSGRRGCGPDAEVAGRGTCGARGRGAACGQLKNVSQYSGSSAKISKNFNRSAQSGE